MQRLIWLKVSQLHYSLSSTYLSFRLRITLYSGCGEPLRSPHRQTSLWTIALPLSHPWLEFLPLCLRAAKFPLGLSLLSFHPRTESQNLSLIFSLLLLLLTDFRLNLSFLAHFLI